MMRHFLAIRDVSADELGALLDLARELKAEWRAGGNRPVLQGKALGMIFQKPSLRTRVSFDMAMLHLGGHALYLSPNEIQLGARESTPDVARVLSRYVQAIMARVFAHGDVEQLAEHSRVPVINGLSDFEHPCQALADLLTIREKRGQLAGLKFAYLGDGNNVCQSLLFAGGKAGMHMAVATPPGFEPRADVIEQARAEAARHGGSVAVTHDPHAAADGADVLYTDVWTSMGQETEREKRLAIFPPFQINQALVARASPDAVILHCLPAHRGEEITDDVLDGAQSAVFDQAENRLHAQKAILVKLMAGDIP